LEQPRRQPHPVRKGLNMLLEAIFLFVAGLVLLAGGAELLVRGAAKLAIAAGISPMMVGLTVVAYGTSSPEVVVSLKAVLAGQTDLAAGNVVGSNIFNVLVILGACATLAPLRVAYRLIRFDVWVMLAASALVLVLSQDGRLARGDGLIFVGGLVAYTVWTIVQGRRDQSAAVAAGYVRHFQSPREVRRSVALNLGLAAAGLALLVVGARWLVGAAVSFATALGISELVIGLTIVAAGTSLPEVATSVVATLRGERDIAVGNVVGSSTFNILGVLGISTLAAHDGLPVSSGLFRFDIPVMAATALACLPVFFTGQRIARWEGVLFLAYYAAYMAHLILAAQAHDAVPGFRTAMLGYVIPLTVITLAVVTGRELRLRWGRQNRDGKGLESRHAER